MFKVSICGASGYTGYELLRILSAHPGVEVSAVTSRQHKGSPVASVFPSLRGLYDGLEFTDPNEFRNLKSDVAFSALPHGASQEVVPKLLEHCGRVVDLSADFRLRDASTYEAWYGEHSSAGLIDKAVYGLPELYREKIRKASLVANPGCYPTSATLALAPALKDGLVETAPGTIIIDSKSGVSGAGRSASLATSFVEVAGGFKAYKIGAHRHTPEIEQELGAAAGKAVRVTFTPHLLPVSRGILTTAYATLKKGVTIEELRRAYSKMYGTEPFVRFMAEGQYPDISQVRCSNYCDIGLYADEATGRLIAVSAIDNLVKGASGQAVQNMNIMLGLDETTALDVAPVSF